MAVDTARLIIPRSLCSRARSVLGWDFQRNEISILATRRSTLAGKHAPAQPVRQRACCECAKKPTLLLLGIGLVPETPPSKSMNARDTTSTFKGSSSRTPRASPSFGSARKGTCDPALPTPARHARTKVNQRPIDGTGRLRSPRSLSMASSTAPRKAPCGILSEKASAARPGQQLSGVVSSRTSRGPADWLRSQTRPCFSPAPTTKARPACRGAKEQATSFRADL